MSRVKFEYIWLDGYLPTQMMRSKTKIIDTGKIKGKIKPSDLPLWSFDGSSTRQAEGNSSDCLLKPVRLFPDPSRKNGYLVICEVLNPDGTPHESNARATINDDDNDFWFGFEQEYVLWDLDHHTPLGFPASGYYPPPQGPYYCSVGAEYNVGREIPEMHMDWCIEAGINIEGVNAEVMKGQWEYQVFAKGAKEAGDQMWAARYLMEKVGEIFNVRINLHPKPVHGDWNGSGMHANFSNTVLRTSGKKADFFAICERFADTIQECIAVYGEHNTLRLTGLHETQSIDKFSYGVSDRGASIRIPIGAVENGWKGWLEDRRPASNADPYKVAAVIIGTVKRTIGKKKKATKASSKKTTKKVSKTSSRKKVAKKKDDLTKVEGIGPKISSLLTDAGISSYIELSKSSATKIKSILADAGKRYQMHDPKTWPKQAKLAASGQWAKLKTLQEKLSGGK